MTDAQIELERLATLASQGPWAAFSDGGHTNIVGYVPTTNCILSLPRMNKKEPNIEYICAANPAAILSLLADIRDLEEQVANLKAARDAKQWYPFQEIPKE